MGITKWSAAMKIPKLWRERSLCPSSADETSPSLTASRATGRWLGPPELTIPARWLWSAELLLQCNWGTSRWLTKDAAGRLLYDNRVNCWTLGSVIMPAAWTCSSVTNLRCYMVTGSVTKLSHFFPSGCNQPRCWKVLSSSITTLRC